jgi:hypothetical protein
MKNINELIEAQNERGIKATSNDVLNLLPESKEEAEFLRKFKQMIVNEVFESVRKNIDTAEYFINH